ncbi:MAG: YSC84-related protein [Phycisphaerales bacterium JB063]
MKRTGLMVLALGVMMAVLGGCATSPGSQADRAALTSNVQSTIQDFTARDAGMAALFNQAYGYAVFPSVGKGGVVVGGAYGRGQAFENGRLIGYCKLEQGTVGLQLGGQSYSEVIFFEDEIALDRFKYNTLEFSAQVSAVAVTAGASADARYTDGVMVFTLPRGGLMFEASVGGQGFTFEPIDPQQQMDKPKPVTGSR